ncbi:5-carboxymethyl-2-hydroxymuconate isomerase [Azonexus hydrophilus]|uniref:5-carboxymethyl-2-hydroxymuconate isomerase n=1 Tax=Azonexus hydrophilus TaxID=418702 RepID=A0A1R1IC74_9RHOO|nr:5-carboxymethyl-2-hydroxymuconate Delta-isomerase [Azonexus hydrophilus]OMG56169.1 5-carboxymethyl-2-hydroxymuconate isomerase [Azonexus hydrophilus]
MPHLTLEYTANLASFDPTRALAAINAAMFDSGQFSEPDIKSRAIAVGNFQVGILQNPRAFVHLRIALLSGRSSAERKELADAALAALGELILAPRGMEIQLSVETSELDRDSYAKTIVHG